MLTQTQEKRIEVLSKKIRESLEECLQIARNTGCVHPMIFVECEGPTFHIMDGDHDGVVNACGRDGIDRQKAILFSLPDNIPGPSDVGAW